MNDHDATFKFSNLEIYEKSYIEYGNHNISVVCDKTKLEKYIYYRDICIPCFNKLMNIKPEKYFEILDDKISWKLENHRIYPQDFRTIVRNLIMCNKY
jgi:energy-converting hydrogenase A subunit M